MCRKSNLKNSVLRSKSKSLNMRCNLSSVFNDHSNFHAFENRGFRVLELGFRVLELGFRVFGVGVQGFGIGVRGLETGA